MAMKARKLLENAALGPDQLKTVYRAFDQAWEAVKQDYAANPQSTEVGRLRLANAVLTAYRSGMTDADAIKVTALQLMQRWG
jgi:hypothetical protein